MNYDHDDEEMSDEELSNFSASPWAIKAGLLVEVNGEVRATPRGLAEIRKKMEEAGELPMSH